MRILLVGSRGMLGRRLEESLRTRGELVTCARTGADIALDVTDRDAVLSAVISAKPSVIVNSTAWTAVDKAESETDAAFAVNSLAPGYLAEAADRLSAMLVHVSTDFVFDGTLGRAYVESDSVRPLSAYGRSKEEGERRVRSSCARHIIIRTQWLYGPDGKHFIATMLRLAREGKPLRVVCDQIGIPTCTVDVAESIGRLIDGGVAGTVHVASRGETSWHGFACEIMRLAGIPASVSPIATSEYPTPARRPAHSSLRNRVMEVTIGDRMPSWQDALAAYFHRWPPS